MSDEIKSISVLDALKAEIKTKAGSLFKSIADYGGQFDTEEIDVKSFNAPAAFTTCLGWRKVPRTGNYVSGRFVWEMRMAVFIVTKAVQREERARQAMQRAEVLSRLVNGWNVPACTGKPEGVMAENLYTRKLDAKGLALWMVAWWQEAEFSSALPAGLLPDLDTVEITTAAVTSVPPPPDVPPGPGVEHELTQE